MYENEKKINKLFLYWLITSLFMVFLIIIVGGLTRLTDSGLSITKWELFKGILPPLSNESWKNYFEQTSFNSFSYKWKTLCSNQDTGKREN